MPEAESPANRMEFGISFRTPEVKLLNSKERKQIWVHGSAHGRAVRLQCIAKELELSYFSPCGHFDPRLFFSFFGGGEGGTQARILASSSLPPLPPKKKKKTVFLSVWSVWFLFVCCCFLFGCFFVFFWGGRGDCSSLCLDSSCQLQWMPLIHWLMYLLTDLFVIHQCIYFFFFFLFFSSLFVIHFFT